MAYPKPSGEFEWVQESWGAALRCTPLAAVAPHCFSTRELALDSACDENPDSWDALARALGLGPDALVRMRQVHGVTVIEGPAGTPPAASFNDWPEADIAVACDPSLALSVRAADCATILLGDRRTGAVAAIHAGWRGTAAGAVHAAVQALERGHGTRPTNIVAAIGPSIGPCCYEVGEDLAPHFAEHPDAPTWFSRGTKPRFDLWRATRDQLERAGVPGPQIHACELCTSDHPALFHSYRRDGQRAGRLVAAIRSARRTR